MMIYETAAQLSDCSIVYALTSVLECLMKVIGPCGRRGIDQMSSATD